MEKKNSLISIGYTGLMRCYLNMSDIDAIERYIKSENISEEQFESDDSIQFHIIEFDDEFNVVVNVKCYEDGTLDLRGKKEEYRIIVPDSKKPIEQILSDAIKDSYDKIKDNLEPPL